MVDCVVWSCSSDPCPSADIPAECCYVPTASCLAQASFRKHYFTSSLHDENLEERKSAASVWPFTLSELVFSLGFMQTSRFFFQVAAINISVHPR